jgi:hypothetical protein
MLGWGRGGTNLPDYFSIYYQKQNKHFGGLLQKKLKKIKTNVG